MVRFYNAGSVECAEFFEKHYMRSDTTELELREAGVKCEKVFIPIGSIHFLSILTSEEVVMKQIRDFLNGTEKEHTLLFVHLNSLNEVQEMRRRYGATKVTRWNGSLLTGQHCRAVLALMEDICLVLVLMH